MSMSTKARTGLVAGAAVGALAIAAFTGTAMANAAGTVNTPSPSASAFADPHVQRPAEQALTGDAATHVKAAVLAKYPGATIARMEKDGDGQSVYEAHITKADGTRVTVMLDASFAVTGEAAGGPGGHGGPGGRHHDGAGDNGSTGSSSASGTASSTNAA